MKKQSAGILCFRMKNELEVLLAHPGGPFFAKKDEGHWTIPKGEIEAGEEPLECAVREFREEIGFEPNGPFIDLGSIDQKGGKRVFAWAAQAGPEFHPAPREKCASFELEWPPRSGTMKSFPEVDRAEFFPVPTAMLKVLPAQLPLLERLKDHLEARRGAQRK